MTRLYHSLTFPTLSHQGEVHFKSWSDSNKTTELYKLDWNHVDTRKKEHFIKNRNTNPPANEFPGSLPEPYDTWLQGLTFAIPVHYLEEIRRSARMSCMEWGVERHFDTMIREICLEPAISFAFVAFRLIADCIYDSETNYFYRSDDKIIVPQALLYKFWSFQTGRGLVRDHSWFHKIEWILKDPSMENYATISKFIKAIDSYEEHLNDIYKIEESRSSIESEKEKSYPQPPKPKPRPGMS